MLALYRSGRQAEALDAYRQARAALVEQIGVEPGPELRRLHDAILRQDAGLEPPAQTRVGCRPSSIAGTPLARREAELDWLREHWRRAHGGDGRLVLIAGARGIGKTRLAAELAAEVRRDGAAVLYASGAGAPADVRTAFERAAAARGPRWWSSTTWSAPAARCVRRSAELADGLATLPLLVVAIAEETESDRSRCAHATLTLAPLDADGVADVARLYAGEDGEPPAAWLVAASGGVPQRMHRLASEWARADAARRLDAAAVRAASERAGLRDAEDALAGNVVELQAARERAERQDGDARRRRSARSRASRPSTSTTRRSSSVASGSSPRWSRGSSGSPLIGIVGPSGSGKSSALRAGLLRRARERRDARQQGLGASRWCGPASTRCARSSTRWPPAPLHERLVVAVDQFEEVFTACRDQQSATRSSTRSSPPRATHAGGRSCCSPSAPTSTGAARAIPSCGACSVRTRFRSVRCAATSCGARSSCPRRAPASRSSPSSSIALSPTSRASPARCRCCPHRCWSCGSTATGAACA